jgi:hypothetical protein
MFGTDRGYLLSGGSHQSAAGQVVCFSEQTARALMYGREGSVFKELLFHAGNAQMMQQILLHAGKVHSLQVAFADNPGGKGQAAAVAQVVHKVALPGKHQGQVGL